MGPGQVQKSSHDRCGSPRPEPANVPPPSIGDFKIDATASVPDPATAAAPAPQRAPDPKPAEIVTAPAARSKPAETPKDETPKSDTATTTPATPAPATATAPAAEPVKAASNVPAADQPVADKLREMLGGKSLRYFDRKAERTAIEKFYFAREYAPQWTQAGKLTDSGKGVVARLKDAAAEGLNPADYIRYPISPRPPRPTSSPTPN
jgi:hypothetical protein